jgi:menaquinone-dependent protoporphyrinogen oxidase
MEKRGAEAGAGAGEIGARSRVAVLYATREGQARRVAEHVASRFRALGATVDLDDVAYAPVDVSLRRYGALVLVASVHAGRHEAEMIDFVKDHRDDLQRAHTAFLSVSLSEAGAEMKTATPEQRAKGAADAKALLEAFCADTAWQPERAQPVAGALRYSEYGFVVRLMMRSIAKRMGGAADTTRDVEYTDWESLDHLVDDLAASFAIPPPAAARTEATAVAMKEA